jgi:hypothetical protein
MNEFMHPTGATFVSAGRTIATARGLYLPVDSTGG